MNKSMKKAYMTPAVEAVEVNMESVLCLSTPTKAAIFWALDDYSGSGWARGDTYGDVEDI